MAAKAIEIIFPGGQVFHVTLLKTMSAARTAMGLSALQFLCLARPPAAALKRLPIASLVGSSSKHSSAELLASLFFSIKGKVVSS